MCSIDHVLIHTNDLQIGKGTQKYFDKEEEEEEDDVARAVSVSL